MTNHRLRFIFSLVTCVSMISQGFVIENKFTGQDRPAFTESNNYNYNNYDNYRDDDDDDDDDASLRNNYYLKDEATGADNNFNHKRKFSPELLRNQVKDRMEAIIRDGYATSLIDDEIEREGNEFDSILKKMMKDKQETLKGERNFKTSSSFLEEKSTQTKIENNGNKGVAVVTGQTLESSSSGNGSKPVVKVAKVVAVATKDGKENGEWKMKPLQEEVKFITPSPQIGKGEDDDEDDDVVGEDDEDNLKMLLEQARGKFMSGQNRLGKLFEEGKKKRRKKRSLSHEDLAELRKNLESSQERKSLNDVDLLKNYIALQDGENKHLMQALDLASEIELNNEGAEDDPKIIDEQMYHMRKALEDEKALTSIRKQIQLSLKNSDSKRSSYLRKQKNFDVDDTGFLDEENSDNDYNEFIERYTTLRDLNGDYENGDDEEEEEEDDNGRYDKDNDNSEEDANMMDEWDGGDITLNRHKLRNDELMDRLKELMSKSGEGWKGESRAKKYRSSDSTDDEIISEENIQKLLKAYRKHYDSLEDNVDYPLVFPGDDDNYNDEDIDPELRRRNLVNSEYQLNPFFRNITKVSEKRFFQDNPMIDSDVENVEPWCTKAAQLVDNCLYARLNGLLPDSEAVDLCNAHQLCYKCGSSNGVTSDECDRGFMERSKELCSDEMNCKRQAASLYVTLMAERQFYNDYEAPDVCTDPCVISILYNRSD